MKKIFYVLGIVIGLIIVVAYTPIILGLFSKDISPIEDSDLQLKNVTLSQSDNAYYDLAKITDEIIYEPTGKTVDIAGMAAGKKWDDKIVEEIVTRNSQAFEYFIDAAHKPKLQDPVYADPSKITFNSVMPSVKNWRRMAQLSSIRAIYLAKQGKDKEALDEALNAARIGQTIQESQAPLIEYLVAVTMKSTSLETTQKIIAESKLNNDELGKFNQEIGKFYKNEDGLVAVLKVDYAIVSHEIDSIVNNASTALKSESEKELAAIDVSNEMKKIYYFHPNETKSLFAQNIRAGIADVTKSCWDIKDAEFQKMAPTSPVTAYVTENLIGKILFDTVSISSSSAIRKKCDEDILVGSTQAITAIKEYKNDTGAYPASLGDLVPKYLASVPFDPYDGKPLKYSSSGKIIYSIGRDLKDSGGSTGDDRQTMADPTFKIGF